MSVLFVHGAWASKNTFNYVKSKLPDGKIIYGEYDINNENVYDIIQRINKIISDEPKHSVSVIAHSMGGLIALALDQNYVKNIVTAASPISGLHMGFFMEQYLASRCPSMREIFSHSTFIRNLHQKHYINPITCLATTKGFNFTMTKKNDGVVTYESQTQWLPNGAQKIDIEANHHEVVMSDKFVGVCKRSL